MLVRDKRKVVAGVASVLALGLLVGACGDDDDGATIREEGPGASGGSGSGSGSASGAGSGSATGGSAEGEECVLVGNSEAEPTTTVEVTLNDFVVEATPASVAEGTIEFSTTNDGEEIHEIVIARFEGEPGDIPTDGDGAADESQLPADAVIGEIEGFAGNGKTCAGAFDLTAGNYALFCNIFEEEESEAHYAMGMYTTFTVT